MSFDCCSDEELIVRLRSGENEIMDYILEKYKPLVRKKNECTLSDRWRERRFDSGRYDRTFQSRKRLQ